MKRRNTLSFLGQVAYLAMIGIENFTSFASSKMFLQRKNNENAMKTIGVLGGLGPQATMDFEVRVHNISQHLITPDMNSGYPPMIVHYCRHAPILLNEDKTPVMPVQPDPRLIEAVKHLGTACDFLVITSNTPHLLQREIESAAGREVLSMIELVIEEIKSRKWQRVGVLGYGYPLVYSTAFEATSIAWETIGKPLATDLDQAVRKVMEGRNDTACTHIAIDALEDLRSRNVDGIVLGCTEIPLMIPNELEASDVINPIQLLAEAAVRRAIKS